MQRTSLLAFLAVFASLIPTSAGSDELILQRITNYRTWKRVTPEITKQIQEGPPGIMFVLAPTG